MTQVLAQAFRIRSSAFLTVVSRPLRHPVEVLIDAMMGAQPFSL